MDPIVEYIEQLLSEAEVVTLLDGSKGAAAQLQLTLIGKIYAGAVTRILRKDSHIEGPYIEGLYKILTTAQDQSGSTIMVEVVIRGESIIAVERMVDQQHSRVLRPV